MGNEQSVKKEVKKKPKKPAGENMLTPITPLFHTSASYDFFTHDGEEICEEMNYGIIPICKLIYEVSKTNFWWKTYYENFFKDDKDVKEDLPENPKLESISWKKMFFKRYYFLTDCYYRTKYKKSEKQPKTEKDKILLSHPDPTTSFCIVLIGDKSDNFLRNLKEEYLYFDRSNNPVNLLYLRNISIGVRSYTSSTQEFDKRSRYTYGCFLCFDVHDEQDFENTINLYEKMKQEGHLDQFSVGLLCGMILIDEGEESSEESTERQVEYNVGCRCAKFMELLGYIECDALERENFVLSFGVVMEGMKRRDGKKQRLMRIRRAKAEARLRAARSRVRMK